MDSKISLFELHNIDCLMEIMFLAVLPEYGKKKIGYFLTHHSVELAQEIKDGKHTQMLNSGNQKKLPQLVSALATGMNSQKIFKKCGFEVKFSVPHTNYIFNGKTYADRLNNQNAISILVCMQLK